ncbi:hypothetical protein [Nocardia heshunensis]
MITAVSYLKDSRGVFVPVEEADFKPPNPRHVEGAIELEINGVAILDKTLWDDVDQLWAYIVNAICELQVKGAATTSFPDQPIELSFRRTGGDHVLVTLESRAIPRRTAAADESELIAAIRHAAHGFFSRLGKLLPENRPAYEATLNAMSGI